MKKIFFTILLIINLSSFSQSTYVPDDNFEKYLINYGYDSGPLDDYVPTNNIKNIETLFLNNLGIENFEGLQDFLELKNLKIIAGSNVTKIDISKNINLIDFQIYGAPLLQNFDTSKNIKLEIFTIENNSINKVNLSKNNNIKDITIGNTKIKNIDLSNNTKLEKIDLNYGIIENVNLNNNQNTLITNFSCIGQLKLKCVRVDDEVYSKANWITITDSNVFSEDCGNFEELTYVPDDGFEQHLIDLGYDSGPLNDYIPTNNINTVKDLSISGNANYIWEIKSLQGLEDFIALEKLLIELNEVVTIDLSNNTNLTELYINSDALLENLNLTNNIKLKNFHCIVTSLTSIDLSKHVNIEDLTIGNSSITELNLSNNTKISKLNLSHNILEKVNFKNTTNTLVTQFSCIDNPNLTCFQVDNENYSKTNWTQIDDNSVFSETCYSPELTYVPDDNFEQELINLGYDSGALDDYVLTDNINKLTVLNLYSKNISDLTGIQDFIALEDLQFTQNNISNVDLSKLTNLKKLYCNNNNISSLDLSNNIFLVDLFCGENNLSNIDVSMLSNLQQLEISNNNFNDINVSSNLNLILLNANSNNLSSLDLSTNINLTYQYCSNNNITDLDLTLNTKLFDLSCSFNPLTSLIIPKNNILDGLHVNSTLLSELDLRNQANLITHPASFLEIQDTPNLTCVYVDNVAIYNTDQWDSITKDANSIFVVDEAACKALSCAITVDTLNDVTICNNYTLPNLINGNYYTLTGGNGTQLNQGDIITSSQIIYIYNEDPTDVTCFEESSFNIIISSTPIVDYLNNTTSCDNYILPNLNNGNYYTQSNGNGTLLNIGDIITSSQTIYIYNVNSINNSCFSESSFNITINNTPLVDTINDITAINSYILPNLSNGNYYTQSNGNGIQLNTGDIITSSQTIYIYNTNSTDLNCYDESSFDITIEQREIIVPTFFTPNNDNKNDTWIVKANNNLIKEIYITDRFGKIVGKILPNTIGWNGFYNGKQLPSNTYWYQIVFTNGKTKNGAFALIRK